MKETSAGASLGQPFDRSVSLLAWGYNEESLIEDRKSVGLRSVLFRSNLSSRGVAVR